MRVIYLWNTAGALTPVADWLVKNGHSARIIMSNQFDIFGNTSISPTAIMVDNPVQYNQQIVKNLLTFKPTHIHVSQSLESLSIARILCPTIPIIFHYHGSEIRFRSSVHTETMLADRIIVSTPDLIQYGEWYDRPVSDMFHYRGGRKSGTAIMFFAPFFDQDQRLAAKKWCEARGMELTLIERHKHKGIPYREMPELLSKFEYMLDFKGVTQPGTVSRTAIEAIACGCKVVSDIDTDNEITEYDFSTPEKYFQLYSSMEQPKISLKRYVIALGGLAKWITDSLY